MVRRRLYRNLAAYLEGEGLTRAAFARRIGIAPSYVSMLVTGERQPTLALAVLLSDTANIPIRSLVKSEAVAP